MGNVQRKLLLVTTFLLFVPISSAQSSGAQVGYTAAGLKSLSYEGVQLLFAGEPKATQCSSRMQAAQSPQVT